MIVVTHEMDFARKVADRVIFMTDGSVLKDTASNDFFSNVENDERVSRFIARVG